MFEIFGIFTIPVVAIAIILFRCIRVIDQYERAVVFTFGVCGDEPKGPGIIFVIPGVQRMVRVDMRNLVLEVPSQDVITKDNITLKVNAVINFRVVDTIKAVNEVENYVYAITQRSQTTLRDVLGRSEMDELLSQRDVINAKLAEILDNITEAWGVKVASVEIKNVDLPAEMQRAMARQAEAERDRRAKIINADAEYQAAQKLSDASRIMAENPTSIQLRYLQTLVAISNEKSTTTIFPFPMELLRMFDSKRSEK